MKNRIGWPLNSLLICQIENALFFLFVLRSFSGFHSFVLFYFLSVKMVRNGRNSSIFRLFCLSCLTRLYLVARVKAWYNILSIFALFFLGLCTLKSRFGYLWQFSKRYKLWQKLKRPSWFNRKFSTWSVKSRFWIHLNGQQIKPKLIHLS